MSAPKTAKRKGRSNLARTAKGSSGDSRVGLDGAASVACRGAANQPLFSPREGPILFSGAMVRALLEGRKTQTRRLLKGVREAEQVESWRTDGRGTWYGVNNLERTGGLGMPMTEFFKCRYGAPGDRLWVKETHVIAGPNTWGGLPKRVYGGSRDAGWHPEDTAYYREGFDRCHPSRWRPSIHMPRWASRITLDLIHVQIERLQDISEEDAKAEGVEPVVDGWKNYLSNEKGEPITLGTATSSYRSLWESLNGRISWEANPWVWRVSFGAVKP